MNHEERMQLPADELTLFSLGLISKRQAIEVLGLRDYADLLFALGECGLPLPQAPQS